MVARRVSSESALVCGLSASAAEVVYALHGVFGALYARARFAGGREAFDDLAHLLLQLLHLLNVLVVDGGDENESWLCMSILSMVEAGVGWAWLTVQPDDLGGIDHRAHM